MFKSKHKQNHFMTTYFMYNIVLLYNSNTFVQMSYTFEA